MIQVIIKFFQLSPGSFSNFSSSFYVGRVLPAINVLSQLNTSILNLLAQPGGSGGANWAD